MGIEIKETKTRKDLKTFVKVPFKIFQNSPYWVPPLIRDDMETFNREKNPAFDEAEARFFIAFKDGKPVGRIAGILSHSANKKYGEKNLRFGWFDTIDDFDVVEALFKTVENWGRDLGMETLTGPLGFNDLDPEGMIIEGFKEIPTIVGSYHHPYVPKLVEQYGFAKDIDYFEFQTKVPHQEGIPEKLLRLSERIKQRSSIRILEIKSRREVLRIGPEIFRLLNETFTQIYGYTALSERQIQYYCKKLFPYVRKEMIKIAVNPENDIIGYIFTVPSLSRAFQKARGRLFPFGWYHILKALRKNDVVDFYSAGVKPKYRGQGIDLLMVIEMVKMGIEMGFQYAESNLELETNVKVQAMWKYFYPRCHRKRRIFKKKINS